MNGAGEYTVRVTWGDKSQNSQGNTDPIQDSKPYYEKKKPLS